MPQDAFSRTQDVTLGEKVARLNDFIVKDLDARAARGLAVSGGCYLVIARSPASPVARALRANGARIAAMGVRVRAIFSEVDANHFATDLQADPFAMPSECRITRDQRLLAAHEQLVLSPENSWVGDCMRREPTKRDAFERFAADCMETGSIAMRSFERLWRASVPVDSVPPLTPTLASHLGTLAGSAEPRPESPRRQ